MRTHLQHRGVTLLETLIAMTVTMVVMAGAVVVMRSQQKAYLDGQQLRGAQGAARRALLAFEQALPNAGFGLDPAFAFDLQGWTPRPCPAVIGACPLDSASGPDELVFFARDPKYWVPGVSTEDPAGHAWRIKEVTSTSVTVYGRAGDVFRKGQIFLAVCPGVASYAYFTSDQTVPALASAAETSITLASAVTTNPFKRQDAAAGITCFSTPSNPARLFLVNRWRFHVRPAATGAIGGATQYDPLLVLDRGVDMDLDGDVDQDDEQLIAEGVESFQVAYGFYSGDLAQVATTPGSALAFDVTGNATTADTSPNKVTATLFTGAAPPAGSADTVYAAASFYPYTFGPPPSPARLTNHQANFQTVRVAVLARSLQTDLQGSGLASRVLPILNQNDSPSWVKSYATALGGHDGYERVVLETSVGLPNMSSRAMTYF